MVTLFFGCTTVLSRNYTLRDPEPVEGPLRTDGLYYHPSVESDGAEIEPAFLWRDGTASMLSSWSFGGYADDGRERREARTVERALATFVARIEQRGLNGDRGGTTGWGAFRIRGDSITIQVMDDYSFDGGPTYSTTKYRGVIVSDTTFTLTSVSYFVPKTFFVPYGTRKNTTSLSETYHFHPLDEMPSSENWTQTHPELQ